VLGLRGGGSAASQEAGEGVGAGGAEDGCGCVGAVGAEVAGAGGVVVPVVAGFGPEIDLGVVVIDPPGEDRAIGDGFEIEGGEEFG
jgi:hypothetical protein